jgi:hypothetical protein
VPALLLPAAGIWRRAGQRVRTGRATMETLIIVFASLAIFFALVLKMRIGWAFSEQNAFIFFCYIFGPVSTILGSFCIETNFHWLLLLSSILFLLSTFFLVGASGIVFGLSLTRGTSALLKACQILSYISVYYVFVFNHAADH